jgi:adenylate cyclase class 2
MSIEFEAKVIEVNKEELEKKILQLGGSKVGKVIMKRYVYDIDPKRRGHWIRLRDDGKQTTLTVKKIHHDGISGTEEEEVMVEDFQRTHALLELMGYIPSAYQENERTSFLFNDSRLEIDHWPMIPPYLEIEADSQERVLETARQLGFTEKQLTGENTVKIYARYGINVDEIKQLRL